MFKVTIECTSTGNLHQFTYETREAIDIALKDAPDTIKIVSIEETTESEANDEQ